MNVRIAEARTLLSWGWTTGTINREQTRLEAKMKNVIRIRATALVASASLIAAACGGHKSDASNGDVATPASNSGYAAPNSVPQGTATNGSMPNGSMTNADTARAGHHSKLGGAVAGAAAGHMLGGHAVLGAAAGALIQHERNKHR